MLCYEDQVDKSNDFIMKNFQIGVLLNEIW